MKIAIMSDSHDNWENLASAIKVANENGCETLMHAGDLIAPPGVAILEQFNGKVYFVWGNNEGEKLGMTRLIDKSDKITLEGDICEIEIDKLKIFMNHYPRNTELAALSGQFDLCIHGHTHIYREDKFGDTILVNPGEIQGYRTGTSTFIIFDTTDKSVRKVTA